MRELKAEMSVVAGEKQRRRWTILDTFDWRLLSANLVLLRDRKSYELHRREGDELIAQGELTGNKKALFPADFSEGALRDKVEGLLSIRAAMPRAEFVREVEFFRVENKDGKTTVRLELETLSRPVPGQKAMPFQRLIRVVQLKGYEGDAWELSEKIRQRGLEIHKDTRHYVFSALEASGVVPLDYTSKIALKLSPSMSAREACTYILQASLKQMQANSEGMLADIDSEFLHDFRVALRRTRSLLQLVKGVYPEDKVMFFKKELGDVMRRTNNLRDLDVYLLEQGDFAELLPDGLGIGLESFFGDLGSERRTVFRKFSREFQGPKVTRELKAWQTFLEQGADSASADCLDAEVPVRDLANRLLSKRFRRILKDGRKITPETPDEAVHDLRIQFKKFRYLLEFFRSLYDADEFGFLIKRSRKIQNVLGSFNDACVQTEKITSYLASIDLKRPEAVQLCAALGALVAELERKRQAERIKFGDAFKSLDDERVVSVANHLFRATGKGSPVSEANGKATEAVRKKSATRRKVQRKSAT